MRKYFIPVYNPHTHNKIMEKTTTFIILCRKNGPEVITPIIPNSKPNNPIIDPTAIKNSIPSATASK